MEKAIMKRNTLNYFELVRAFPLRPVRTKAQHARAIKTLLKLLSKGEDTFSQDETDYFEALAQLVERYERTSIADDFQPLEGVDLLKFLMHERGMNVTALGKVIGSQSAASLVLSGKRELSKSMIAALGEFFKINPSVFLPKRRKAS
jgi:HTH-type transcriptional regulator/antitoxin HigA